MISTIFISKRGIDFWVHYEADAGFAGDDIDPPEQPTVTIVRAYVSDSGTDIIDCLDPQLIMDFENYIAGSMGRG